MASDERTGYRESRALEHAGSMADAPTCKPLDLILRRGADMRRRNHRWACGTYSNRDGRLETLGHGSKWRSVAARRAELGLSLLGL